MANSVKEQITADLQKAKSEGGLRAGRIREIVRTAVSEAVIELKAGSVEMRTIAKDAMIAVAESLKDSGKENQEEVAASVAGIIDGINEPAREQIADAQFQIDQLQTEIAENEQTIEANVDGVMVGIAEATHESTSPTFRSLVASILQSLKENQLPRLQERVAKLKEQLVKLDATLVDRYGDRYTQVKQRVEAAFEAAKVRYVAAKARVEAGEPNPVEKTQADWTEKANRAGATVARTEEALKQSLKTFFQTAANKQ